MKGVYHLQFSDIHIHALYGCDDGAKSLEDMYNIIQMAYIDGARYICLTPHYNPGYFGENSIKSNEAFNSLLEFTKKELPDLQIVLGNELRYNLGCEEWLSDGRCRCMNNSKYVLVDFSERESKEHISKGLGKLLSAGYIPILAHAERYCGLRGNLLFLKEQRDNGVLIQIDTKSILGGFGLNARMFSKKILKNYLADFVSSDAHDTKKRPPGIKEAYEYIEKKYGTDYAEAVCFKNAFNIIFEQ